MNFHGLPMILLRHVKWTRRSTKSVFAVKEDQMLFKKKGGGADYPDRSLTKKIINNLWSLWTKKKNQLHVICVFWCLYILSSFDIPIFFQNILFTIISNKHACIIHVHVTWSRFRTVYVFLLASLTYRHVTSCLPLLNCLLSCFSV